MDVLRSLICGMLGVSFDRALAEARGAMGQA